MGGQFLTNGYIMATRKEKKFDKMSADKKLKFLKDQDNPQRIRFLQRITDPAERDRMAAGIPGFEAWWKANKNMPGGGRKGGVFHGATEGAYNIPQELPENVPYRDLMRAEAMKGLPEMLERLRTPYTHPMVSQMQDMFGHLQNPILQNLLNPDRRFAAGQSLFPSEIESEYQQYQQQHPEQGAFGNLMSALGQNIFKNQIQPGMANMTPERLQELYGQAEQLPGQAYEYASSSRPAEYLRNMYQSQPAQVGIGALEGFVNPIIHPFQTAQDLYGFAKTLPGEAYKDIGSLLSTLGSYLPSRKK